MADISTLYTANAKRWTAAKLTRRAEYLSDRGPVPRILAARNRYELVQAQTGVHWTFVAATHYRESDLNFSRQLAQGDPLSQVSHNVPAGRGPFQTFEQGAYDALVRCQPKAALNPLWKQKVIMPAMLTLEEMYNGLGYWYRNMPSPYVWSGTDQYHSGKFIRDGIFDLSTVDKQLGVAGIYICLLEKDPNVFGTPPSGPEKPVETTKPNEATPTAPPAQNVPEPLPKPSGPIINKQGEDITDLLHSFIDELQNEAHAVWEWLRKH